MKKIFFIICLLLCSSVFSISVRLTKDTIFPNVNRSTTAVVSNPSDGYKAVEAMMLTRSYTLEGEEIHAENDDFILIPPQFILSPGQDQVVTIQWISDKNVDTELPYRLIVQEVPLPSEEKGDSEGTNATVKIRLRFVNSFYVAPELSKDHVVGISATPSGNSMVMLVENKGSKHKIVGQFEAQFTSENEKYTALLGPDLLKASYNFLPYEKRYIVIDWPSEVPKGDYTLSLKSF